MHELLPEWDDPMLVGEPIRLPQGTKVKPGWRPKSVALIDSYMRAFLRGLGGARTHVAGVEARRGDLMDPAFLLPVVVIGGLVPYRRAVDVVRTDRTSLVGWVVVGTTGPAEPLIDAGLMAAAKCRRSGEAYLDPLVDRLGPAFDVVGLPLDLDNLDVKVAFR